MDEIDGAGGSVICPFCGMPVSRTATRTDAVFPQKFEVAIATYSVKMVYSFALLAAELAHLTLAFRIGELSTVETSQPFAAEYRHLHWFCEKFFARMDQKSLRESQCLLGSEETEIGSPENLGNVSRSRSSSGLEKKMWKTHQRWEFSERNKAKQRVKVD